MHYTLTELTRKKLAKFANFFCQCLYKEHCTLLTPLTNLDVSDIKQFCCLNSNNILYNQLAMLIVLKLELTTTHNTGLRLL